MRHTHKTIAIWLLLALMFWAVYQILATPPGRPDTPAFSRLVSELEAGRVKELSCTLTDGGPAALFVGRLADQSEFATAGILSDHLLALIQERGLTLRIHHQERRDLLQALSIWLPVLVLVGFFLVIMRQLRGKGGAVGEAGRSPARRVDPKTVTTGWDDIAGADDAKQVLRDLLARTEASPARVLLVGPPGCGKTMLARALAHHAKVPFLEATGSDFIEMFVGVGAARLRSLFDEARKAAPSVVFIDDLDAIGRTREQRLRPQADEREQTLLQLLQSLDGFTALPRSVAVVAATSRPELLDRALIAGGRFERIVEVPLPDRAARAVLLERADRTFGPSQRRDLLLDQTDGLSAAEITTALSEATRLGRIEPEALERAIAVRRMRAEARGARAPRAAEDL